MLLFFGCFLVYHEQKRIDEKKIDKSDLNFTWIVISLITLSRIFDRFNTDSFHFFSFSFYTEEIFSILSDGGIRMEQLVIKKRESNEMYWKWYYLLSVFFFFVNILFLIQSISKGWERQIIMFITYLWSRWSSPHKPIYMIDLRYASSQRCCKLRNSPHFFSSDIHHSRWFGLSKSLN